MKQAGGAGEQTAACVGSRDCCMLRPCMGHACCHKRWVQGSGIRGHPKRAETEERRCKIGHWPDWGKTRFAESSRPVLH